VTPVGTPESIQAYVDGIPYKPEVLESTELGLKTELFGGTTAVQADVFHYNYKNYQAYFLLGTVSTVRNAPARAHGFELQVSSRPVDGLTIDIGMSVLRTRVKNVGLPDGFVRDSELPQAPGFSGHLLAGYEMPAGDGKAGVQLLTTYTGQSCFSVMCAPVDVEGSHAVSEGRLTYRANSGRWDVALWCKNLTNKRYRLFNSDASFGGIAESLYAPPRWYGVTATVRLGTPRR
jgi:iron complex outermembrane receptor protein